MRKRGTRYLRLEPIALLAFVLTLLATLAPAVSSPDAVGDWEGTLDAGAQGKLRVVLHVTQAPDGSLAATLDSPDQKASGIPVNSITYKEPTLQFASEKIQGSYEGKMNKDKSEIAGTWTQGGGSLPLTFKRLSSERAF